MKDMYPDPESDSDTASQTGVFAGAVKWIAAFSALSLVVAIALWTYQLGQRDASQVPVIKAMQGPAKVRPDDPGGLRTNNQGLAVNEVVEGTLPKPKPDQVALAPREEQLRAEDVATADLAPRVILPEAIPEPALPAGPDFTDTAPVLPPEAGPGIIPTPKPEEEDLTVAAAPSEPRPDVRSDAIEAPALVPRIGRVLATVAPRPRPANLVVARAAPQADEPGQTVPTETALSAEIAEAVVGADPVVAPAPADPVVGGSPLAPVIVSSARRRPASLRTRVPRTTAADREEAAIPVAARETDDSAKLVPNGAMLVQLGAFNTPDIARAEWQKIVGSHSDLLGNTTRVVEKTVSGGRTLFRLRARGFDDLSQAKATCAALQARNAACIPVRQK